MEFEWDDNKDKINRRKHDIAFADVAAIFLDEHRIESFDGRESYGEDRWLTIGLVDGIEFVVVYTLRHAVIRIISARKAEAYERKIYWQNR